MRVDLRLTLLAMFFVPVLSAQIGNATINGQLKGHSGRVVPNAVISVKNTATNVVQDTLSNAEVYYLISSLISAAYTLAAEAKGFKKLERENIVLRVWDGVTLDLWRWWWVQWPNK
jgi:hypothetical protein